MNKVKNQDLLLQEKEQEISNLMSLWQIDPSQIEWQERVST